MEWGQMKERCPSSKFLCSAQVYGYRLAFTRFSIKRQCGVADILSNKDAMVWGAVFEMSDDDVKRLDRKEGVFLDPPAYQHLSLAVLKNGSPQNKLETFSYQVVKPAKQPVKPSAQYMELIIKGAIRSGLPSVYIEELRQIEVE
jgi:gamma-glutamylcyclotransferase